MAYRGAILNQKGCSMLHWIKRKVVCKKSRSRLNRLESDKPSEQDRQTDIVVYRGAVCNQPGSPWAHWILGRLQAKNQGPQSRDKPSKD